MSGLFQAFFSFGGLLGPTLGGVEAQAIVFEWTATVLAIISLIVGLVITAFQVLCRTSQQPRRSTECTK